jgi:20S proteasome alpha/beta subunit
MILFKREPIIYRPSFSERQRPIQRPRLTIAAGFRFGDGVLVCADTQVTTPGYMKQSASKIVPIDFQSNGGSKALFTITGSVPFAHMAIEHCRRALAAHPPQQMTTADMMISIEDTLQGFFEDHLFRHPNYQNGSITVELIIGIWSHVDHNLTLLSARENAVSIVRDYECLGAGQFLTNYLLPKMFRHSGMGLADTVHIAMHVLRETKNYVDSCGGGTEIIVLRKDGSFAMAESIDHASGEQISEAYHEAIRRLFLAASDITTTEADLRLEFDSAFMILQATRERLIERHKQGGEESVESVRALRKRILDDYKIIKS